MYFISDIKKMLSSRIVQITFIFLLVTMLADPISVLIHARRYTGFFENIGANPFQFWLLMNSASWGNKVYNILFWVIPVLATGMIYYNEQSSSMSKFLVVRKSKLRYMLSKVISVFSFTFVFCMFLLSLNLLLTFLIFDVRAPFTEQYQRLVPNAGTFGYTLYQIMRIDVTNLSKIIRGSVILDNISIHFESGHIYGIIGKNGSGKTMLLRAISGLIVPSSGVVYVDGKALGTEISFPPEIGILIEKPEFLGHLSGFENLKMLSEIKGSISDANIAEYMNYFDLDPEEKKPVRKYSQGMKQKLGIIQAIMENQKLLVLDEPFNALDEKSVKLFRELLIEYKKQEKLIILTSHNKEDIESLCDHTYQIQSGQIIAE